MKERIHINRNVLTVLKCLLLSYVLTGVLLLLLAFLLYQFKFSENIVSVCIIIIYIGVTFLAGFVLGKRMEKRKFLWGLLAGGLYFLILILISLLVNQSVGDVTGDFFSTLLLCLGSGMLGGMLS